MYASSSTQQPAAICALKSPADAIHVLEAVRVGLVPRVTRRLTGHERAQIRPGTVWVWEEEETNMRRWTDGRRWGASRVGGGGFLVYTESSESHSPPSSRSDSPNKYAFQQGFYQSNPHHEPLVKQTYSTTMTHPVTGKVKKFHVVGYSSKHNPQGDAHNPLPLPHQLPLLANLQVPPGIWPEWERRRDGSVNGDKAGAKSSSSNGSRTPIPPLNPSPDTPLQSFAPSPYPSSRPTASAPPAYPLDPRVNGPYNTPYYYPPPSARSAPPYAPNLPPPHQVNDRYHPYRDRPPTYPVNSAQTIPDGYDERRASNSSSLSVQPPQASPNAAYPYSYPPTPNSAQPYGAPYRDPYRRDTYPDEAARSGYPMMPPAPYYNPQDPQQPPPQESHHSPTTSSHNGQPMHTPTSQHQPLPQAQSQFRMVQSQTPDQGQGRGYLPRQPAPPEHAQAHTSKLSITSALSGENVNSGGFTLPPLRVAIDDNNGRLSPGGHGVKVSPSNSPAAPEGRRELGELAKKVSL